MLTQGIEVMKYVRASAGRAGLSVTFEDTNQPRHDGKTIYLPRITAKTTDEELKQLMASVDHEVAHDRFSSFTVLKERKLNPQGILMFVWNFLEDSRINVIEANEYRGFRDNWDDCSCVLIEGIVKNASKDKESLTAAITSTLLYWETKISGSYFPKCELAGSRAKYDKKILDVLNNFSDRLVECQEVLDKSAGTKATLKLAEDILKELGKNEEELLKPYKAKVKTKDAGEGDSKASKSSDEGEEKGEAGKPTVKDDEEYKILNVVVTEDDLKKFSLDTHEDKFVKRKVGVNFDPVNTIGEWDLTDFEKFLVIDYPRKVGKPTFFEEDAAKWFLQEHQERVGDRVVSQENFAQQVRRLIQIRAKVQRQYGVKKGKLDQARLSRICFNAPGFNERIFKNKIENTTLDAAITVLVDMSGSMCGEKAHYALSSALLVNEVCSTLNLPVEILGFTDGNNSAFGGVVPIMYIYKAFNDLKIDTEQFKLNFAMSARVMQGNPDGENILWAHHRLVKRKEKKKLLIVMSDGSPAASKCSSGLDRFTRQVIDEIEKSKTVDIYGLGLCSFSVQSYYKSHSVVTQPEEIPTKLLELIERKIINV